eukprot:4798520-Alexandrium_andersonii.AAC.1
MSTTTVHCYDDYFCDCSCSCACYYYFCHYLLLLEPGLVRVPCAFCTMQRMFRVKMHSPPLPSSDASAKLRS